LTVQIQIGQLFASRKIPNLKVGVLNLLHFYVLPGSVKKAQNKNNNFCFYIATFEHSLNLV
jgi:hypothetical protein